MDWLPPLAAVYAGYMLWRNVPRAAAWAWPGGLRITGSEGGSSTSPRMARAAEELEALGFVRLGAKRERGPLGEPDIRSEVFLHEGEQAYADLFAWRRGEPFLYFFSLFPDGAQVLTADHKWHQIASASVQAGGLPGAPCEAVWNAHKVATARFEKTHGKPVAPARMDARVAAAKAWYEGAGRKGLRRLFLVNVAGVAVALLLLVAAVGLMLRPHR